MADMLLARNGELSGGWHRVNPCFQVRRTQLINHGANIVQFMMLAKKSSITLGAARKYHSICKAQKYLIG